LLGATSALRQPRAPSRRHGHVDHAVEVLEDLDPWCDAELSRRRASTQIAVAEMHSGVRLGVFNRRIDHGRTVFGVHQAILS
jgi:hypothetical protein